ncbi:hypothetical protein DFQ27_005810 [Actinomortierella ambigua]|uniref:Cytidyltransferase-like domain-containing protein n=1 Tax=Actinomortierella ambigua TaxID=1343610 RepID=A0A9P6Q0X5_9FUNG|nr:hypothetical protein DFQ26_005533 [Actinomortierella ambigua]KAG0256243.1 hypothetical protein DFQ27_005810 [Actinomortierella ambigua]
MMRKEFLQLALAKARSTPPKAFQTTLTSISSWPFTVDRPPSTSRPTTIAVLDSSFNPPTVAHYHLLKAAARKAVPGCDAVLLLLAMNNVDKGQTGASAIERLEMMEALALECIRDEREETALRHMAVGLTIHARFIDKAQPILDSYPPETVRLSWIMGHDTLTRLLDPKYYKDIKVDLSPFFERNHAICSTRPDYGTREDLDRVIKQSGHADKVTLVEIEAEDEAIATMSSTIVRKAVQNKDWNLVKSCVMPSVEKIIIANDLYSGTE